MKYHASGKSRRLKDRPGSKKDPFLVKTGAPRCNIGVSSVRDTGAHNTPRWVLDDPVLLRQTHSPLVRVGEGTCARRIRKAPVEEKVGLTKVKKTKAQLCLKRASQLIRYLRIRQR
jgi:hypothetical protein